LVNLLPLAYRQKAVKLLEKRRIDGLSDKSVVSLLGPVLELVFRRSGRLVQWSNAHDRLASWWVRHRALGDAPTVIHCFQDSSIRTLRAAKAKGIVSILEITMPPLLDTTFLGSEQAECDVLPSVESLRTQIQVADFVLVQSEFSARTAVALGAHQSRLVRLHLGVDTQQYRPREGARLPGPIRVLFLGGASRRKGVHHLLEAWNAAEVSTAELLIGGNRSGRSGVLSAMNVNNCRHLGFIPDEEFSSVLRNADILVNPSLSEGGSNVVYEAMASGLPCIVSENAGSAVRNGVDGFVVGVGDIQGLRDAIRLLCTEDSLREQMGRAARRRAESLSWEHYAENLGGIYASLADPAKSPQLSSIRF
jgi:glycosyltransferase involved in cell wall biosynthesis